MQYFETLLLLCCLSFWANATDLPDTTKTGEEYLKLAQQQEAQNNVDQAVEYYELAKNNFDKKNDKSNVAYVLTKLASFYISDSATWYKAGAYLDSAQFFSQKFFSEDDTLLAHLWSTKAELALVQEDYDKAVECYQQSLETKKAFYGENHLEVADNLEKIGNIYLFFRQNPYASEAYHQQAREIRELLNDQSRFFYNCIYRLAYTNRLQGDYEKALADAFIVLQGYENQPDPNYGNIVFVNSLLGSIYYGMDSIPTALKYNTKAISLAIRKNLIHSLNMPVHYNNQAEYHFQIENYDSTIHYAHLAIAHQTRSDLLASSYQFLGNGFRGKGKLDQAFYYYRKSRDLKEDEFGNQHTQLALLYIDMGKAYDENGQLDSALNYYQKAFSSAQISRDTISEDADRAIQVGDDLSTMQEALTGMTSTYSKQYDQTNNSQYLQEALLYYRLFDQTMDLMRSDLSTEGAKLILSGRYKVIYEQAVANCYQLYQSTFHDSLLQEMLHYMEKSKAMVLLESIRRAEQYQQALPDSLVQAYQSLSASLANIQSEIIDAERKASDSLLAFDLQRQKAEVLQNMEVLNRYIQANYPNYYDVTYRDLTIHLDSLQPLVSIGQPIVSYFWGDSAVYALLISADEVKIHQIDEVAMLREHIVKYRDILAHDSLLEPSYDNFISFQESAHQLYQLLLEPLIKDNNLDQLTIVPDGDLTTIPFDSFITSQIGNNNNDIHYEQLPYLIKRYGISSKFSLSIAFRKPTSTDKNIENGGWKVAAFGIKNFDSIPGYRRYPRLGGAEKEVQYIQEKFPQAEVFLDAEATETQFKIHAPKADVLHVATHGMADIDNPFASQFIFYPGEGEDGTLHLYELYGIPLKAQLLMLSACQSGVGKYYAGEGNFSLARSFVYAGCKSVLMSLWEIQDIFTEELITGTYNRLAEQQTVDEAIRNTKLSLIEGKIYAHPQCWAGIVPLGNTNIDFPKQRYSSYIVALVLVLGLGLIYLARLMLVHRTT